MRRSRTDIFETQNEQESMSTHDSFESFLQIVEDDDDDDRFRDINQLSTVAAVVPNTGTIDSSVHQQQSQSQQTSPLRPNLQQQQQQQQHVENSQREQPLPNPALSVRNVNADTMQRAVDLWNDSESSLAASSQLNPSSRNNEVFFSSENKRTQHLRDDSQLLLSAVRKLAHFSKHHFSSSSSSNNLTAAADNDEGVEGAFSTLIRFATRDLRFVSASLSIVRPLPPPFDEVEYLVAVVSNSALHQVRSCDGDFSSTLPRKGCSDPAGAVVHNVRHRLQKAMSSAVGHQQQQSSSSFSALLLQTSLLIERVLSRCLEHIERHINAYFESTAATKSDEEQEQPMSAFTNNPLKLQKQRMLNPHRIAAVAQLQLFEHLVFKIILMDSNKAVSQHQRLRQWFSRHSPVFTNTNSNSSSRLATAASVPPPAGLRRFRILTAKADPTFSRRLTQCWSEMSKMFESGMNSAVVAASK